MASTRQSSERSQARLLAGMAEPLGVWNVSKHMPCQRQHSGRQRKATVSPRRALESLRQLTGPFTIRTDGRYVTCADDTDDADAPLTARSEPSSTNAYRLHHVFAFLR